MTEKNDRGREIHKGPRGGEYVLEKGRKVYRFKRVAPAASLNVNVRGRTIHKGSRGGEYVLEKGRKVYRFKRAVPVPKRAVPVRVAEGLLRIARDVKKRRAALTRHHRPRVKIVLRRLKRFSGLDPTSKTRPSRNHVVTIHVPEGVNTNAVLAVSEDTLPMQKWLNDQSAYIQSLSDADFYTAMAYTVRSHLWIGPWLRNGSKPYFSFPPGHTVPLYHQIIELMKTSPNVREIWERHGYHEMFKKLPKETLDKLMEMYVKDLQRIIRNAPPLPSTMYVYRGVKTNIFRGKIGAVHSLKEFASTAYVPQYVYASDSYLRIKLLKGTRVLLLQGLNQWEADGEFEILLNKGSHYVIRKRYLSRLAFNRRNMTGRPHKVTDVTVF